MKQNIMKSLLMLVLALLTLPVMSQDDMRIYFKDGTNRQIFLREVNGITTSQIDENGTIHSDAYYQHVETTLGELVFDLSEIDSISFTKYDEAVVKENVQKAMTSIMPSLNDCQSISDAEKIIDQLKEKDAVNDVWSDEEMLYVDIDKFGTIAFHFGENNLSSDTRNAYTEDIEKQLSQLKTLLKPDGSPTKIVIANQQYKNDDKSYVVSITNSLIDKISKCNVQIDEKHPTMDFYRSIMFKYDVVVLVTHGTYDPKTGTHFLLTADELDYIPKNNENEKRPDYCTDEMLENFDRILRNNHALSQPVKYVYENEARNGKDYWCCYPQIYESFFDNIADGYFPSEKSILLASVCHSLEGNENLANILRKRGLGTYIGYDGEIDGAGVLAGKNLLLSLMNGKSVEKAYNDIPDEYRSRWKNNRRTWIHMISSPDDYSTFITPTYTNEKDENSINQEYKDKKYVIAEGITTFLDDNPDGLTCGFEYGPSKYIYDRVVDGTFVQSYKSDKGNRLFTAKLSDLEPGQTYYYRAYTYDGLYYNYGEPCSFTIEDNNSNPYAVLATNGTLTFYCDNKRSSRKGNSYEISGAEVGWSSKYESIKKVVFDSSFANARPTSTANWFWGCSKLSSIVGIENLVTDNVTDMGAMFGECSSLTSIDVSGFKTDNVTNMGHMFGGCSRLTSIDVGGFETDNVTDMTGMFWGCSNLSSLDLSGFRTGNVTSMNGMFYDCSKLRSIYVSGRWSTRSVTEGYIMFTNCYKLVGGSGTTYDPDHVDYSYAHIDGGPGDPGYLTED
jgi:surface protein